MISGNDYACLFSDKPGGLADISRIQLTDALLIKWENCVTQFDGVLSTAEEAATILELLLYLLIDSVNNDN